MDLLYVFDMSFQDHPFINLYKNLWADNGDYISHHYVGTGSTTSSISRGNSKFQGIMD
jgi:hypothetical protein